MFLVHHPLTHPQPTRKLPLSFILFLFKRPFAPSSARGCKLVFFLHYDDETHGQGEEGALPAGDQVAVSGHALPPHTRTAETRHGHGLRHDGRTIQQLHCYITVLYVR